MPKRKVSGTGKSTPGSARQTKVQPAQVEKKKQTRQKVKTGSKVKDGNRSPVQEEELGLASDEVIQNGSGRRRGRSAKLQAVKKMATMQEDVKTADDNDEDDEDDASLDLEYDDDGDNDEDEEDFEATLSTRKRANTHKKNPSRGKLKSHDNNQQPEEILTAQVKNVSKNPEERYLCQASQEEFLSLSESDSSSEDEDIRVSIKSKQSSKPISDQSKTVNSTLVAADRPKSMEERNEPTELSSKVPTDSEPKSLFDDLDDIPELDNSQTGKVERCTQSLFDDVDEESDHEELNSCEMETDAKPVATSKYFAKDEPIMKGEMPMVEIKGNNARFNAKSASLDKSGNEEMDESDFEDSPPPKKAKKLVKNRPTRGTKDFTKIKEETKEEPNKKDNTNALPVISKERGGVKSQSAKSDTPLVKKESKGKGKESAKKDDTGPTPTTSKKIGRINSQSAKSDTPLVKTESKGKGQERAKKDDTSPAPTTSKKIGRAKSQSAKSDTPLVKTESKGKGQEVAKKDDTGPTPTTSKKIGRAKNQSAKSDTPLVKTESKGKGQERAKKDDTGPTPTTSKKIGRAKNQSAKSDTPLVKTESKGKRQERAKKDDTGPTPTTLKKIGRAKSQSAKSDTSTVKTESGRRGAETAKKDIDRDPSTSKKRGRVQSQSSKSDSSIVKTEKSRRGGERGQPGVKDGIESPAKKRKLSVRMKKLPADAVQKAGRGKTNLKMKAKRDADHEMEVDVKTEEDAEMSSDDSHSDWEEVEDTPMNELGEPMVTPTKKETKAEEVSLEIDIDLPGTSQAGKKKKREYNWANYFQWQVNKYNKEKQLQLHKAHLVLLLASGFNSNNICNKMELQCLALSTIPPEILSKKPKLLNINYLTKVLSWFKNCFKIRSDLSEDMVSSLDRILPSMFERRQAASERELVHMFAIIMRCLGADVRLIFSLQPMTFKAKQLTKKFKKENAKAPVKIQSSQSSTPEQKMMQHKPSSSCSDMSSTSKSAQPPSKSAMNTPKTMPTSSHKKTSPLSLSPSKLSPIKSSSSTPKTQTISVIPKKSLTKSSQLPSKSKSSKSSVTALKKGSTSSNTKTTPSTSVELAHKTSSRVQKTGMSVSTSKTSPSKASQLPSKSLSNNVSATALPTKATSLNSKTGRGQGEATSGKTFKKQNTAPKKSPTSNVRNKTSESKGLKDKGKQIAESGRQTQKRALRAKNTTRRRKASKMMHSYAEDDEYDESDDDHSDYEEELRTSASKKRPRMTSLNESSKKKTKMVSSASSIEEGSSDSDFEEVRVMSVTKQPKKPEAKKDGTKKKVSRKMVSSDSEEGVMLVDILDPGSDCWLEVYLSSEKRWMCVDCVRTLINKPEMCEKKATKPITYVIAVENDGCMKDITRRYASKWMTETHKLRRVEEWWEETIKPYMSYKERDQKEDSDVQSNLSSKPLPTSVSEYKNHPLYALKRHLLKFESLYPESAAIIGYCRGEAVYSRECVHTLHTRETWMKEGKAIRIGEKPYKMVKPRPKWKKGVGMIKTEEAILGIFGAWQVEDYIPPPAVDGKVPRNEYGNVELFKPTMLPAGTVHLKIPGLNKVARKLNLDCAPAMTGWDFHSGFNHPVMDGFVVCEEHAEVLVAAWEEDRVEREKKEKEKREARAMDHWKLFIKSLLIRERLKERYGKNDPNSVSAGTSHQPGEGERKDTSPVKASWPENKMTAFTGDAGNLLPFEKKTKTKKKKR